MQPIQLFELASRQAEWLSVRQEVVANNIANANTPQFRSKDVTPFETVMKSGGYVPMARTNPAHFSGATLSSDKVGVEEEDLNQEIGTQESGNTVALATELAKTGEIKRQHDLNTTLVKSFHSMMMSVVAR